MNPQILMVIDHQLNPKKYTQKQLKQNAYDADNAYFAAYDAYAFAAVNAADADAAYWLRQYFKQTGENKQDFIDAINKDDKQ